MVGKIIMISFILINHFKNYYDDYKEFERKKYTQFVDNVKIGNIYVEKKRYV